MKMAAAASMESRENEKYQKKNGNGAEKAGSQWRRHRESVIS
jgi:hypothetical protein